MTDKPIIIDGVDVNRCGYLQAVESLAYFHSVWECSGNGEECSDNPNCYYKQLQRKTAEYEELKKNNDFADVVLQRKLDKLMNKNNRLEEELNQIKLLLEGKNNQYNAKQQEREELQAKYKWYDHYKNSALSNKELCDKKSDEIKLLHYKLQIATEALEIIANQNFKYTSENICNLAQNEQIPCSNNCKYCFQQYAQHALEQIEGILNEK